MQKYIQHSTRYVAGGLVLALLMGLAATCLADEIYARYFKDDRDLDEYVGRTAMLDMFQEDDGRFLFRLVVSNPALCGGSYEGVSALEHGMAGFEDMDCRIEMAFGPDFVDVTESPAPCMTPDCPVAGRYHFPGHVPAMSEEEAVTRIREHYSYINGNLDSFELVEDELEGWSTEGGEYRAFIAYDEYVKKVVMILYGEMGRESREYYYWDNDLLFCFQTLKQYDRPLGEVASTQEHRYYYHDHEMIRWIGPDGNPRPRDEEFIDRGWQMLEAGEELRNMALGAYIQ